MTERKRKRLGRAGLPGLLPAQTKESGDAP